MNKIHKQDAIELILDYLEDNCRLRSFACETFESYSNEYLEDIMLSFFNNECKIVED